MSLCQSSSPPHFRASQMFSSLHFGRRLLSFRLFTNSFGEQNHLWFTSSPADRGNGLVSGVPSLVGIPACTYSTLTNKRCRSLWWLRAPGPSLQICLLSSKRCTLSKHCTAETRTGRTSFTCGGDRGYYEGPIIIHQNMDVLSPSGVWNYFPK